MPNPAEIADPAKRQAAVERALEYMGLQGGQSITTIKLDRVFIGSCTNSRIEDLRAAASVVKGKKVAASLKQALVVPGSGQVKAQAEAEGLDKDFRRSRFGMARAELLDVSGDERRQTVAGRALRVDL